MRSRITNESKKNVLENLIEDNVSNITSTQYLCGFYYGNLAVASVIKSKFKDTDLENISHNDTIALLRDILQFVDTALNINQEKFLSTVKTT
jgi:hypothetical protein